MRDTRNDRPITLPSSSSSDAEKALQRLKDGLETMASRLENEADDLSKLWQTSKTPEEAEEAFGGMRAKKDAAFMIRILLKRS